MRKTGLSYVAIEYALRAARELGDADWALQLRAASGNQLGGGFAFVDSLVLQVLLEAERLGDARTILKVHPTLTLDLHPGLCRRLAFVFYVDIVPFISVIRPCGRIRPRAEAGTTVPYLDRANASALSEHKGQYAPVKRDTSGERSYLALHTPKLYIGRPRAEIVQGRRVLAL